MLTALSMPLDGAEMRLVIKAEKDLGELPSALVADIPLRRPAPWDGYELETARLALRYRRVAFSPDGARMAYIDDGRVYVDGQESAEFTTASSLTFSPDGHRFAYVASFEGELFVVVDDMKHPGFPSLTLPLVFSPDSEHVAYSARVGSGEEGKWKLVVDGVATGKEYDFVDVPLFNHAGQLAFLAVRGSKKFYVVDDVEGAEYDSTGWLVFSLDGRRHGYFAGLGACPSNPRLGIDRTGSNVVSMRHG